MEPEKLPRMSYASHFGTLKRQNSLWTGPKATRCPKEVVCQDNKVGIVTTGLMVPEQKSTTLFRISVTILCYLPQQKCLPFIYVVVPLSFLVNALCLCLLPESAHSEQLFLLISDTCLLPFTLKGLLLLGYQTKAETFFFKLDGKNFDQWLLLQLLCDGIRCYSCSTTK